MWRFKCNCLKKLHYILKVVRCQSLAEQIYTPTFSLAVWWLLRSFKKLFMNVLTVQSSSNVSTVLAIVSHVGGSVLQFSTKLYLPINKDLEPPKHFRIDFNRSKLGLVFEIISMWLNREEEKVIQSLKKKNALYFLKYPVYYKASNVSILKAKQ